LLGSVSVFSQSLTGKPGNQWVCFSGGGALLGYVVGLFRGDAFETLRDIEDLDLEDY